MATSAEGISVSWKPAIFDSYLLKVKRHSELEELDSLKVRYLAKFSKIFYFSYVRSLRTKANRIRPTFWDQKTWLPHSTSRQLQHARVKSINYGSPRKCLRTPDAPVSSYTAAYSYCCLVCMAVCLWLSVCMLAFLWSANRPTTPFNRNSLVWLIT